MIDGDACGAVSGMRIGRETEVLRGNLGRHGGKPVTNRLSYAMAIISH
jgi:hypothetical protein